MFVIALDQALQVSGYAIFNGNKLQESGTFSLSKTKPIEQRLALLYQELENLLQKVDDEHVRLVFEDIQLQAGNVKTYQRLAYVQAAILLWCYYHQINYDILPPSHWRKVLGGGFGRKRDEQKQHAIDLVRKTCGKEVTSDEADAICIGLAALKERRTQKVGFDNA